MASLESLERSPLKISKEEDTWRLLSGLWRLMVRVYGSTIGLPTEMAFDLDDSGFTCEIVTTMEMQDL
ncbi:hypothetical protein PanWU01x14_327030 [Parasponia andersonii]|uniref:Uncharacterized protein n=1 Tax=Parasponia andersonii TaxID=3476 RepID=A0A2P5AJE7_PARAD|nr:hypothetical protein PanWU01x14_327030 [Parasponia andersonii]